MAEIAQRVPDDLDLMLRIHEACGFSTSIIDLDGTVYGWAANTSPKMSKVEPPRAGLIEVWDGEAFLFKVATMAEARAFVYGMIMAFCGGNVEGLTKQLNEWKNLDADECGIELHKLGWCPIWNRIENV